MPLILGTNSIKDTGYDVANSLRFNPGSSDTLSKTLSTPTNNKKFTFSFWIKKCENGREQHIVNGGASSSQFYFNSSDQLYFYDQTAGGTYKTTQVFRDVSAWMHIVVAEDTTQGTASSRIRIYVNGSEITDFAIETDPTQNNSSAYNTAATHTIGTYAVSPSGYYLNGYLAEFVFIDGQQLTPTSFGEFDEDSPTIWKPKDVSGLTFGNNGFHLDFENASSLGADVSGNGNNFTVNNLTSIDQSTDTCTNNFATWNPLIYPTFTNHNLLEGNLTVEGETSSQNTAFSTIAVSSGKWFCEMKLTVEGNATSSVPNFGIASTTDFTHADSEAYFETSGTNIYAGRVNSAQINRNGSDSGTDLSSTPDVGDIIGLALDLDSGTKTLKFYLNGSLVGTVNINTDEYCFICAVKEDENKATVEANFGGTNTYTVSSGNSDAEGFGNFEFAVPSGYFALCTKNLAEYG